MVPMKKCPVLLIAGLISALPLFAADEKVQNPAPPAVQVVLKRVGQTPDEVTTTGAVIDHKVEGKLSINIGTTEQPKFRTVEFESEREGWIMFSVSDSAQLRETAHDGTSYVTPVELFRMYAPFDGSGTVPIYKTKTESLTLTITPVANAAKEKPEAE